MKIAIALIAIFLLNAVYCEKVKGFTTQKTEAEKTAANKHFKEAKTKGKSDYAVVAANQLWIGKNETNLKYAAVYYLNKKYGCQVIVLADTEGKAFEKSEVTKADYASQALACDACAT